MGKTNCGNKKLAFLASAIKERWTSRRTRLLMQLALNNLRRFFTLVGIAIYYCLFTPQLLVKFVLLTSAFSRFISFLFSPKSMSRGTPLDCPLSNPLHSTWHFGSRSLTGGSTVFYRHRNATKLGKKFSDNLIRISPWKVIRNYAFFFCIIAYWTWRSHLRSNPPDKQPRSQGPLSSYLEKVPWLRLVTCLLDFSRFQRCDSREGLES